MANIILCKHCSTECTKEYCRYCGTEEARQEMCKDNKENNPKHTCKVCGITNEG